MLGPGSAGITEAVALIANRVETIARFVDLVLAVI
jgi:hypothetical protein